MNTRFIMRKKIYLLVFLLLGAVKLFGQCQVNVLNGSFEQPVLGGLTQTFPSNTMTSWVNSQTSTLWLSAPNAGVPVGTIGVPGQFAAKNGNQFLELGAGQANTIYQDISTDGAIQLTVTFSHRGRGGAANGNKDECELFVGAPNSGLSSLLTFSDNNAAWQTYTVVYTVPANQPVTRFQFFAGPTASGTGGNFIDDFNIVTNTSISGSNSVVLACTAYSTTVIAGGLSGTWIQDVNNPSITSITKTANPATFKTSTVFGGFAVIGTYRYTWHTGYCDAPLTITVSTLSAVTPTISYAPPIYAGNVLSLASTSSLGASLDWRGPNGFSATISNPVVSNNATTNMSGLYSLTSSLINSCSAVDLGARMTVTVLPVTITFNPAPTILNGGQSLTLLVNIAPAVTTSPQVISLTALGNAISGTNYSGLPSQVTIPQGASSISFTITGLNNNIVNGQTTLNLRASSPYYSAGANTITIFDASGDNLANRLISVSSGTVSETLSKTLTLSLPSSISTYAPITITLNTNPGYSLNANPIVIPAGGTSATFVVQTVSDGALPDNVFSITGTALSIGATAFPVVPGTLTVTNKDQTLSIDPVSPIIGSTVLISVVRSAPGAGALSYSVVSNVGAGSATIDASGNLLTIQAGDITLTVSTPGDANFLPVTATRKITISKVIPVLSITSGTTLAVDLTLQATTSTTASISDGGVVTFSINNSSGSAVVDPYTGLVTGIGAGTVTLIARSAGDINYAQAETSTVLTIVRGEQALTLNSSTGVFTTTVGGAVFITANNSVANGGTIVYSLVGGSGSATVNPNTGLVRGVSVGTITFTATALLNDDYNQAVTDTVITIGISSQTLTINPPVSVFVGSTINISTSRSVSDIAKGGPLSYTLLANGSGSATVDETTGILQGIGAGTATLVVTAMGNPSYYLPVSNTIMITVRKVSPTLSLTTTTHLATTVIGGVISLTATSTPPIGGPVATGGMSFSILIGSNSAVIDTSTGQLTAIRAGNIVVQVTQTSDDNYNAPAPVTLNIFINKATPTLALTSTTSFNNMTVGSVLALTATSTVPIGAPISMGSITFGIISGSQSAVINAVTGQLTAIRAGSIVIQVSQRADLVNYYAAKPVTMTITIDKGTPSLSLTTTTGVAVVAVNDVLTVLATSIPPSPGGSVLGTGSLNYTVSSLSGAGSATIQPTSGVLTAKASGEVLVQAVQAPDVNYNQSIVATLTITVGAGAQALNFASSNYVLLVDEIRSIPANNSVSGGGTITYAISAGSGSATVNIITGLVTAISAGTVTLSAQAEANSNYGAASASTLLVINKANQVLTIVPVEQNTVNVGQTLQLTATTTATGGRGGNIQYSVSAGTGSATVDANTGLITAINEGSISFNATANGDTDYNSAQATRVITVIKGSQILSITSSSNTVVGGSIAVSVSTTAQGSDGGISLATYTLSSTGAGSATIDPTTHIIIGRQVGTVRLNVSTPGNANYAGGSVTQVIHIGKGTPTLLISALSTSVPVDGVLAISSMSLPPLSDGIASTAAITYRIVSAVGSGTATIDTNTGILTAGAVGSVVVQASQGADSNYHAPTAATITINIIQATQILSIVSNDFMGLAGVLAASVTTNATGGRGGILNYSIQNNSGMATVSPSGEITASQTGKVTLVVNTLGDADYSSASVSQVITIVSLGLYVHDATIVEGATGTITLGLIPVGVTLSKDVTFGIVGSSATLSHYSIPAAITLAAGDTDLSILLRANQDKILYNNEHLVLTASNSTLGSATGSLTLSDSTSLDSNNLVITIDDGTLYLQGGTIVHASLPAGVTTVRPIAVRLYVSNLSDFGLLSGMPEVSLNAIIPGDGQTNFAIFSVTATSGSSDPAKIIIEGTDVTVGGISTSFTIKTGVITVINQRLGITAVISPNGDGINDCFLVSNIDKFYTNEINIISRYGNVIYHVEGYNNKDVSFCGLYNGDKFPPGAYYYVVKFKESIDGPYLYFKGCVELR